MTKLSSSPPEASIAEEGEKLQTLIAHPLSCLSLTTCSPVYPTILTNIYKINSIQILNEILWCLTWVFQRIIFPSVEHDAIIVPNGENLTQLTPYECPISGDNGICLKTDLSSHSHKRTDLSFEALTNNLFPVKSTQLTSDVWPSRIWCETSINWLIKI